MKTLKLDHQLAERIRSGDKTATWRLYDDKDIRVNDEVELLDKVDPQNPETWQIIGVARIDVVVEKRLGEISKADFRGHETFASRDEMLETYRQYYGPQVTFETPVKMIHFTLLKKKKVSTTDVFPKIKEAKMYADGGSRGNPGPSASGFAIMDMQDRIILKEGVYLGVTTNNQAEYQALRLGLEQVHELGIQEIHVYMDSLLVINQMKGIFKVKNRDLWPIHEAIKQLASTFKYITFTHVPRELNKIADREVNEALDAAAARQ
jgi:ribonuclease HI